MISIPSGMLAFRHFFAVQCEQAPALNTEAGTCNGMTVLSVGVRLRIFSYLAQVSTVTTE